MILEVRSMNLSRIESRIRGDVNGALNTFLGIIAKSQKKSPEYHNEVKLTENIRFNRETEKVLRDVEANRGKAIEVVRNLQKC